MARPQKQGMDYFPHDTDAAGDEKIDILRTLYGNDGYAFYFILLERIYRTAEFELDVSDAETRQILAKKVEVTPQKFEEMLQTAIKKKCFCQQAFTERGVLTSNGIKKRAASVVNKRQKMAEAYKRAETTPETPVSDTISDAETTPETGVSAGFPSREKERKEKERKAEKRKANKPLLTSSLVTPTGVVSVDEFIEVEVIETGQEERKIKKPPRVAPPPPSVPFDDWWNLYRKSVGKAVCARKWEKLTNTEREQAVLHTRQYVQATPNVQYRKNPETYLNQKAWNDEIIERKPQPITSYDNRKQRSQRDPEEFQEFGEELDRIIGARYGA